MQTEKIGGAPPEATAPNLTKTGDSDNSTNPELSQTHSERVVTKSAEAPTASIQSPPPSCQDKIAPNAIPADNSIAPHQTLRKLIHLTP